MWDKFQLSDIPTRYQSDPLLFKRKPPYEHNPDDTGNSANMII